MQKKQSCSLTHAKLLLKSSFNPFMVVNTVNRCHFLSTAGFLATVASVVNALAVLSAKERKARHQDGRRAPQPGPHRAKGCGLNSGIKGLNRVVLSRSLIQSRFCKLISIIIWCFC